MPGTARTHAARNSTRHGHAWVTHVRSDESNLNAIPTTLLSHSTHPTLQ
jgi:hypothetical protein